MSHNTVFGSVSREIEGGTPLIGGVAREIESGLVLVGGVAREIAFSKPTHTLTITGIAINTGGSLSNNSLNQILVNGSYLSAGTYEVEEGTTITVTAYAVKNYNISSVIYLNGAVVKRSETATNSGSATNVPASYSLTVSGDVNIACERLSTSSIPLNWAGSIKITTS